MITLYIMYGILYILGFILFRIVFKTTGWHKFYNLAAIFWFIFGIYHLLKHFYLNLKRGDMYE